MLLETGEREFGASNSAVSFQLAQVRVGAYCVPVSLVIYIDSSFIKHGIPVKPIYGISVILLLYVCYTPVISMSYSCLIYVILLSYICHTPVVYMSYSCRIYVILLSYICHTPVVYMSYSCHKYVILTAAAFPEQLPAATMTGQWPAKPLHGGCLE